MRLSAYLGLSLLLLALAGCFGGNSTSSTIVTPPDGGTDNGGGDDGSDPGDDDDDDNGGDDGDDDNGGGDNDGGDTGTPPPDCAFTDPVAPASSETLGNTNDTGVYALENYAERTDLNSDLTGTWVMVHRQVLREQTSLERDTIAVWQKSVFIIRDNGGVLEASDCRTGGFAPLDTSGESMRLALFPESSQTTTPAFVISTNTRMSGSHPQAFDNITFSGQYAEAIKVSGAVAALGQSSITLDAGSDNNADIVCVTQKRELTMQQVCTEPAQPVELTLNMVAATTSDKHHLRYHSDGIYSLSSQLGNAIQLTAPTTNTISADASSVSVNIALDNAVIIPEASPATGSLTFTANLPGAVPAP